MEPNKQKISNGVNKRYLKITLACLIVLPIALLSLPVLAEDNYYDDRYDDRYSDRDRNDGRYSVETNSASNIKDDEAVLNGYLSNTSSGSSSRVWFEWGRSPSFEHTTSSYRIIGNGAFTRGLTSLTPNTIYYFRAVADTRDGIFYGQTRIFRTEYSSNYYSYYNYNNYPYYNDYYGYNNYAYNLPQYNIPQYTVPQVAVLGAYTTGATLVSTGIADDIFTDSFIFPLIIIIAGLWLYFSGRIYKFADWIRQRF